MNQLQNLLGRLSNLFTKDSNSNLGHLLGSIGSQLDQVDPAQTNLEQQFSVSTATGSALDSHGKDWGLTRKASESDDDYRTRLLAQVPIYTNGPTIAAIKQIVRNFTGVDPIILEYGPDSFTMGVSPMGSFVFGDQDPFTFQIQVQNPNGMYYDETDLENAVNFAKPARSTATFIHNHNALFNGQYKLNGSMTLGG
ncbi:DUF2313 domain-containing protein [Bacillus sp. BRMEA1]|uniref:putative phage tail protein n=1 Tax=Neobacillus endophyticus TaxID=2738405 RepID=UPI001563E4B6|nr:putative phage tail protein [Neobacillus endophyticus]NRD80276.1 DUF2313 domain-containing protein [Neobacillus endophyticus]